jgi:hypothetical protein
MNTSWQEQRREIAVWLSGYLGMVKKWVDRILDNEDHDVDKNKILKIIDEWITYLQDERHKIMVMKDKPINEYEVRPTEQQRLDGMDEG